MDDEAAELTEVTGATGVTGVTGVTAAVARKVQQSIRSNELFGEQDVVLVACSGGPDSVALLALLRAIEKPPRLVVAHVDHGLRPESSREADFVRGLAERLGLEFVQRRLDLAAVTGAGDEASENTAREARLAALEELAEGVGAQWIALGHTANDQLETVLMRLCRGAGTTGLAAMAPRRGRFVRPLLEVTREEVCAVIAGGGWSVLEDPTNRSDRYFRNRVRHHVIPLLLRENPRLVETAARSTRVLRGELEVLAHYEELEWERLARADPLGPAVDMAGLTALPRGMASRLVRRLWQRARDRFLWSAPAELGAAQVSDILERLEGKTVQRLELPGGVSAVLQYDVLVFAPTVRLKDPGDVELAVPGPGAYSLPQLGVSLEVGSTEVLDGQGEGDLLDFALPEPSVQAPWPLVVRNLRPGDRIRAAAGRRKLSDLLIDHRVPRYRRRRLPLVVLAGEIVWIPGVWMDGSRRAPEGGSPCRMVFRSVDWTVGST